MQSNHQLDAVLMPDGSLLLESSPCPGSRPNRYNQLLQEELLSQSIENPDNWLFFLGLFPQSLPLSDSLHFWRSFARHFLQCLKLTPDLEALRTDVALPFDPEEGSQRLAAAPLMPGGEYLSLEVLEGAWQGLLTTYLRSLEQFDGTVAEFFHELAPDVHLVGRIYFHLVENRGHDAPFAFLATYSTRLNQEGESRHLPLKYALEEYGDDPEKLLALLVTVDDAALKSDLIAELRQSGELFHPLALTTQEALCFLQEIPIYEEAGILCRIPNWWRKKSASLTVRIDVGDKAPATFGLGALLDFRPKLMIDDAEITAEEARRLLLESEGLAFLKNKWVAVDPDRLRQTLEVFEQACDRFDDAGITLGQAMHLAMHPQHLLGEGAAQCIEVSHGQWLQTVVSQLKRSPGKETVKPSRAFTATLRPYQQDGLNWLWTLHGLQLGGCLADDMGLGKTIQVLAFLDQLKAKSRQEARPPCTLLVIPASLLANWISEFARFAPRLSLFVAHPDFHRPKRLAPPSAEQLAALDVVLTTYALVGRHDWLGQQHWDYIILDEAQAIKNPASKQTKAVKQLSAGNRIVMTGTPVENRLADLWSLFDFINPGLLGSSQEFTGFSKLLRDDAQGYARLRRVTSPFILRRLKTDRSIITDLPDKVEVKTWSAMSKKQAVLYDQLLSQLQTELQDTTGIQRKGLILSALLRFKQICNHPAQYLGLDSFDEKESGKFQRLREICATIEEKRERVLVFTQFKEMTEPLARFLTTLFGREGLILHGSIPAGKRKQLIAAFQGRSYVPFFVLSLKAGGVGLNLTAANHVIHFDRWWNPAVENQATDRAFRIGQTKNVMVHKFLTQGTIEEKIDQMLTTKATLAREVVAASGENWLTEMDNQELFDLLALSH
jgi:superfamily II DNA or RNA helicase